MFEIFETDLFWFVALAIQSPAHRIIDGRNAVQHAFVVGLHSVGQENIVLDSLCLMFADKIADHIHQSFCLFLIHELCRIDTLGQEANIVQIEMTLTDIEPLAVRIIDHEFFIAVFVFLQHFPCFFQRAVILHHEVNQVDFLDVLIDGSSLGIQTAFFQKSLDLRSRGDMVFISIFQEVLKYHIGLQFMVGLFSMRHTVASVIFVTLATEQYFSQKVFLSLYISMCGKPLEKNPVLDNVEQCVHLLRHKSLKGDGSVG